MRHIFINQDFKRAIKRLRRILPFLSFGLLIATYLISAIIMGIFHAQKAPNTGFMVAAFLVPLAIQAGRGTLVFFFQLNPGQIQGKYSLGFMAATALLLLSLVESIVIMAPYGFSWVISVATLMLIGWVIEIMILKETIFATQMELYQNKEKVKALKEFYIARYELEKFMKQLENGRPPALSAVNSDSNIGIQEIDLKSKVEEQDRLFSKNGMTIEFQD